IAALQNGQDYYQQALVQERAAGNLEAAIQLFQDAARYAGSDRALAAQALMGAARCYEKLGQAKARELYEEIARTYTDQQQLARQAKERAQALQPRPDGRPAEGAPGTSEPVKALYQVAPGMYWSTVTRWDTSKPVTITGTV